MKRLNLEQRFSDDLRKMSGSEYLCGEILQYFAFNKYLPDYVECIGMIDIDRGIYVVYRGNVSVDDAYLHKCYKVKEFYYTFTVYHGSVAVIASKNCHCGFEQISVEKFQEKMHELPMHPTKDLREDFERYNTLQEE